ncbi:hypothetical protein LTR36_004855 [Oleoguttula mirabilis]|uniref:Uncharacterized protein n=1 Tax=Oleoguttula mirabilis TaxID=1507867 RepID=A0AAV9JFA9_9PEZI|nr:hypothetical protein LTR36_004855 [Oleoguttula mirabilis]
MRSFVPLRAAITETFEEVRKTMKGSMDKAPDALQQIFPRSAAKVAAAKRIEDARKSNEANPFLRRLPPEIILDCLRPLMHITCEGQPHRNSTGQELLATNGPSPLAIYGSICRKLRPTAITAYYDESVLHLRVLPDPHQRVALKPKPENFARFGKIELERGGQKRSRFCTLKRVARKGYVKGQYGLELPPQYVRQHVQRIYFELLVPENMVLDAHPTRVLFRPTVRCTAYDDESNDWLAPIFALPKQYGFESLKGVMIDFMVPLYEAWASEDRKKLRAWVNAKLRADADVRTMMEKGSLQVSFESPEIPVA